MLWTTPSLAPALLLLITSWQAKSSSAFGATSRRPFAERHRRNEGDAVGRSSFVPPCGGGILLSSSSYLSPPSHRPSASSSVSTRRRSLPLSDLLAEGTTANLAFLGSMNDDLLSMDQSAAERLAGPFFGASLFPYLGFLYFLDVPQNGTPRGVTVGFATCLLFVFLTIPAAIASKVWYDVSLADCDWLHGSAESLLTITNLVTVLAFRGALDYEERRRRLGDEVGEIPYSYRSYTPMIKLVAILTFLAFLTALYPAATTDGGALVHTPYLSGFLDLPPSYLPWVPPHREPENALTVACWIIHVSSLVEFLVAMGFCWRWAEVSGNPRWKGLTWGLIPLHTSGITACTYHLFYNSIPVLVPLQAALTFLGNTTAVFAAYRIAVSNGWTAPSSWGPSSWAAYGDASFEFKGAERRNAGVVEDSRSSSLVGFEDLGDALAGDDDYSFVVKLFVGCAIASYVLKYGEVWFDFPFQSELDVALAFIFLPSMLNAFKWYKRSQDPSFNGWF